MKAFLDANVLLEVILERVKQQAARDILQVHIGELHISALTAHLVVHFGQKVVDLATVRAFLTDYDIIELSQADFLWAFQNARNSDFEDALQISTALRSDSEVFYTFDANVLRDYGSFPLMRVTDIAVKIP